MAGCAQICEHETHDAVQPRGCQRNAWYFLGWKQRRIQWQKKSRARESPALSIGLVGPTQSPSKRD